MINPEEKLKEARDHRGAGRFGDAAEAYSTAIEWYDDSRTKDEKGSLGLAAMLAEAANFLLPDSHRKKVAISYGAEAGGVFDKVASTRQQKKEWPGVAAACGGGVKVYRALVASGNPEYRGGLESALARLGYARWEREEWGDAAQAYAERVEVCQALAEGGEEEQGSLGDALYWVGRSQIRQERWAEAGEALQRSVAAYKQVQVGEGGEEELVGDLAVALHELGFSYWKRGNLAAAEKAYKECADTLRALLIADTEDSQVLESALAWLGHMTWTQKDWSGAAAIYQERADVCRTLVRAGKKKYREDLGESLFWLAMSQKEQGRWSEAVQALQESLQIYRQLAKENPKRYADNVVTVSQELTDSRRRIR